LLGKTSNKANRGYEMNYGTVGNGMTGVGAGALPITGVVGVAWMIILAVMLIGLGAAVSHFVPRKSR
jgi:hypothetical protein